MTREEKDLHYCRNYELIKLFNLVEHANRISRLAEKRAKKNKQNLYEALKESELDLAFEQYASFIAVKSEEILEKYKSILGK